MTTATDTTPQAALFDTSGEQFNINWVDENQALFIPNNPLHYKAHKLQVLLQRLDKQAEKNPAQFNSANYTNTLNAYIDCVNAIKPKDQDEVLDAGRVAESRQQGTEDGNSPPELISMDS